MKVFARITYLLAVVLALGTFLAFRRTDLLSGDTSTVDTLVTAVFLALVLLPVFREVSLGGVTLKSKIEAIVHHEVGKAQLKALQLTAQRDLLMMPIWEQEHSSVQSDFSEKKVSLLEQKVTELEKLWADAPSEDKTHCGMALRVLYWEWLSAARHHWASSSPYQEVWRRVEKGFAALGDVPHAPSR